MVRPDLIEQLVEALGKTSGTSSDFDLNPGVVLSKNRVLKPAAVLVPIIEGTGGLRVVLTKRSSVLKHHPGQVAFPGGKVDETDADIFHTALREAEEEIGLNRQNVEILGQLPDHETVTGFSMTPD